MLKKRNREAFKIFQRIATSNKKNCNELNELNALKRLASATSRTNSTHRREDLNSVSPMKIDTAQDAAVDAVDDADDQVEKKVGFFCLVFLYI